MSYRAQIYGSLGSTAPVLVPTHRQSFTVTRVVYTGLPEDNPFTVFRDMSRHLFPLITAREPSAPADNKQHFYGKTKLLGAVLNNIFTVYWVGVQFR